MEEEKIILSGVNFDIPSGTVEFEISESLVEDSFKIVGSNPVIGACSYRLSATAEHNRKSYFLQSQPIHYTLDKWLNTVGDIWCPIYKKWNVNRPKDKVRQVLKGMVVAVSRLHRTNRSHGDLNRLENYVIRFVRSKRSDKYDYAEVTLIGASDQGTLAGDRDDLCKVIFDTILEGNRLIASDWDDLRTQMKITALEECHNEILIIASHSAFWHWKSKKGAYSRYWDYMIRDKTSHYCRHLSLSVASYWKTIIPQDSPFSKVYAYPGVHYDNSQESVVFYVRNFFLHIDDEDFGVPRNYDAQTEAEFVDPQYVEKKVADLFPYLLQELVEFSMEYMGKV